MTPDEKLVLDDLGERLEGFHSLRKSDSERAGRLLSSLGASDEVDREIMLELAAPKPLWLPDRFLEAHRLVVRSLEVLDRNGTREPPLPRLGPLVPVLDYLVTLVSAFIVRTHLRNATDHVHRLYVRREANCAPDDPARPLLRRARQDLERVSPGFRRNPLGIPTFLLGGAFLSATLGRLQDAFGFFRVSSAFAVVATLALVAITALASWVILRGAAVAHRRIDLTVERPLMALWETIGRCGDPPRDQSNQFAMVSIALIVLALLVLPVGLALTVFA